MDAPDVQAKRILALVPTELAGWGIVRCDGTHEELVGYRSGSGDYGWDAKARCAVGDLLVGSVGEGRSRMIVNVNRVERVTSRGTEWMDDTDVPIAPSIGWKEVGQRFGRDAAWRRLEGPAAKRFINAIVAELRTLTDIPESEGNERLTRCRDRSVRNRARKLDEASGVCEGCSRNFRVGFGFRGDRALEVHHRRPISESGANTSTRLSDLVVLCAACHRLVHADPDLRVEGLKPGWIRMHAES